jgi:hypothetical protein
VRRKGRKEIGDRKNALPDVGKYRMLTIGQEEIVSCSSDYPTRWLDMKKTLNIV